MTASGDNTARVWDAQSGQPLTAPLKHDGFVISAQFSADGKWIVTASRSMDEQRAAARVWDAQSGQPLTEPMKHDDVVSSAQFSPDGKRIVTASGGGARVWDISARGQAPAWLPRLAEAVAGQHLNDRGVFEPLGEDPGQVLEEIRAQLNRAPADDDWTVLGRWFLADRSTRTISPFSKITIPEYIENRIKENTPASLDEAARLAAGNTELLKRIADTRAQSAENRIKDGTPKSLDEAALLAVGNAELLKRIANARSQLESIENRIKENTPASLNEAERLAVGNAELLKRIASARAQLETNLANSYADAGRWDEAFPLWAESFARHPQDTGLALKIATLQLWFGKDADHAATSRRMLELAAGTDEASTAERAAKAYCLRPSSNPQLLESAVTLARRAVDLGKNHPDLKWDQLALGMAEYRHGNFPAADQALSAAEEAGKDDRQVQGIARLFHAMSFFKQGKMAEARQLFGEAEAQMPPLPADEKQPLANGADADSVIVWLAYKEAKALLQTKAPAVPPKPAGK